MLVKCMLAACNLNLSIMSTLMAAQGQRIVSSKESVGSLATLIESREIDFRLLFSWIELGERLPTPENKLRFNHLVHETNISRRYVPGISGRGVVRASKHLGWYCLPVKGKIDSNQKLNWIDIDLKVDLDHQGEQQECERMEGAHILNSSMLQVSICFTLTVQ